MRCSQLVAIPTVLLHCMLPSTVLLYGGGEISTLLLHSGEITTVLLQCIVSKSIQFTMKAVINQVGGWLYAHVDEEPDLILS